MEQAHRSHASPPETSVRHLEKQLKEEREKNVANARRIAQLEAELRATSERLAEAEALVRLSAQRHLQGATSSRKRPAGSLETQQAQDAPRKVESEALKDFFDAIPKKTKDTCISLSRVSPSVGLCARQDCV